MRYSWKPYSSAGGGTIDIREAPTRDADVIAAAIQHLRGVLPASWEVETGRATAGAETTLTVRAPDGTALPYLVEAKRTIMPRDVPVELERLRALLEERRTSGAPLLMARYLAPSVRRKIEELGASFADATGNVRLVSPTAPLFVAVSGADKDPWRGPGRPRGSLKGAPAARVVRALVDHRPPYMVSDLIERSGASTGATYRVVAFLEEEALIERQPRGPITEVAWRQLLERWSRDYGFDRADRLTPALEPRGLDQALGRLRQLEDEVRYVVTGSVAARYFAPYAPARSLTLYVDDPQRVVDSLALRPIDTGANVLLAANQDTFAFERSEQRDGLQVAAPSQIVVDLLSGPGRGPAEAEELLDWMEGNEDAWRR